MAIALRPIQKPSRPGRAEWRGIAATLALAVILVGIALSGGLQLPEPVTRVDEPAAASGASLKPVFDNRGKWTGYAD